MGKVNPTIVKSKSARQAFEDGNIGMHALRQYNFARGGINASSVGFGGGGGMIIDNADVAFEYNREVSYSSTGRQGGKAGRILGSPADDGIRGAALAAGHPQQQARRQRQVVHRHPPLNKQPSELWG